MGPRLQKTPADPVRPPRTTAPTPCAIAPASLPRAARRTGLRTDTALTLAFAALAAGLFGAAGVWTSELGGFPDEPAHFVTGLMARDYLASAFGTPPLRYAQEYYDHYPKVAIGHWPPGFYGLQAAWLLVFPPGRLAALALMVVLLALLAATVARVVRIADGPLPAVTAAALLLSLPLVQRFGGMVMTEVPVALLSLWAVLWYGRYLNRGTTAAAVGFGLLASAAILTKGTALALALVPPLALVLSGRLAWLRRASFWLPALLVVLLCGPWYVLTRELAAYGLDSAGAPGLRLMPTGLAALPTRETITAATTFYSAELVRLGGWALFLPALLGFIARVVVPLRRGRPSDTWAALGACLLAVWAFHCVVPCNLESRHLVAASAPLLCFWAAGAAWLADAALRLGLARRPALAVLLLAGAGAYAATTFAVPRKAYRGLADVAAQWVVSAGSMPQTVLISSDSRGEGIFVAEIALRDARPRHTVVRVSKLLSDGNWDGSDVTARYDSLADLHAALRSAGVGTIVIDRTIPPRSRLPHHDQIEALVTECDNAWRIARRAPFTRDGRHNPAGLEVYVAQTP